MTIYNEKYDKKLEACSNHYYSHKVLLRFASLLGEHRGYLNNLDVIRRYEDQDDRDRDEKIRIEAIVSQIESELSFLISIIHPDEIADLAKEGLEIKIDWKFKNVM